MRKKICLLCALAPSIADASRVELTPDLLSARKSALKKVELPDAPAAAAAAAAADEEERNDPQSLIARALRRKFDRDFHGASEDDGTRAQPTTANKWTARRVWSAPAQSSPVFPSDDAGSSSSAPAGAPAAAAAASAAAAAIPESTKPTLQFLQELLEEFNSVTLG